MVFVFQRPMFQEDEGRYQSYGQFGSERQAELFIEEKVKDSNGYLGKSNFIITKEIIG